jgi:hypothetical protein
MDSGEHDGEAEVSARKALTKMARLERRDNDLLIIDSEAAAKAFESRFDAIFAEGEAFRFAPEEQSP